eukprot:1366941-Rhodomonas_salina.1
MTVRHQYRASHSTAVVAHARSHTRSQYRTSQYKRVAAYASSVPHTAPRPRRVIDTRIRHGSTGHRSARAYADSDTAVSVPHARRLIVPYAVSVPDIA